MRTPALSALLSLCLTVGAAAAPSLEAHLDATDLPRHLLRARLVIPKDAVQIREGRAALWYPKWIPGVHAPGGPVQNLGGLIVRSTKGDTLEWTRDPAEAHRILVRWPSGVSALDVELTYITDQPTVNSDGVDSYGSESIGFISPNTVLLYPEGADLTRLQIDVSVVLPQGWRAATSLEPLDGTLDESGDTLRFARLSVRDYVDAPLLCGRYIRRYDLVEEGSGDATPPHTLHVASERERATRIDETPLAGYRSMVTQATRLFDSHPFPRYDLLLATSDILQPNGLEHLRSSFNVVSAGALADSTSLKGWERMLVPHEYVHAWCGKYRRPAGMATRDYHATKDTRLLWVYEGLTQYLGKVLEARSGLMTTDDFRWQLRRVILNARAQQGRSWRSLEDTAAMSELLRAWSKKWGSLRRGQDYYHEGMLLWLAADARIRNLTDGKRSLDDFSRLFFRVEGDSWPRAFDRAEVVRLLNQVASDDWDGFIRRHAEVPQEHMPLDVLEETGYLVQFSNEAPKPPEGEKREENRVDARESLGLRVGKTGWIGAILLGSPADRAGLAPGLQIAGVDGKVWSPEQLDDAIERSVTSGRIELLVISGDTYVTRVIEYDGGPRHLVLVRDDDREDRIAEIMAPRPAPDPAQ